MTSSPEACVVLTTVASRDKAHELATRLVENRLAACVQILPIESVYAWQGAVQHGAEILLLIKTRRELYPPLEAFIKEVHGYDVPEIIQLPVEAGSDTYLHWIADVTAP